MTVFVEFLSSKPLLFLLPSGKEQSEEEGEEGENRDEGRKKFSMSLDLNSTLSVKRHGFKFTLIKSKRFEREMEGEIEREIGRVPASCARHLLFLALSKSSTFVSLHIGRTASGLRFDSPKRLPW